MIKIVVIEDEIAIKNEISYLISLEPDTILEGWSDNVQDAINLIVDKQPDIVLMDIQLKDGTAFDILDGLNTIPNNIIFITAFNQFAIRAIKCGALDYLLKPIIQEELQDAFQKYREKVQKNLNWFQQFEIVKDALKETSKLPESIALNSLNNVRIIQVQDIVYCKGNGPYTIFYFQNGEKETISKPLKFYEELFPSPYFLRSHQSYLVNRNYISGINNDDMLVLKDKTEIPISQRRKSIISQQLILK